MLQYPNYCQLIRDARGTVSSWREQEVSRGHRRHSLRCSNHEARRCVEKLIFPSITPV